jgi:hypothetical protein
MIPVAIGASLAKELVGLVGSLIESPDTYKRLDGLRQIVEKVTGKEIDSLKFLTFLEVATQGEPITGKWEQCSAEAEFPRRLRVDKAWIYDIGRGNPVVIDDK